MRTKLSTLKGQLKTFGWLFKLCFRVTPFHSTVFLANSVVQSFSGIFGYYATARVTVELIRFTSDSSTATQVWRWFIAVIVSALISNIAFRANHILDRKIYFALSKWSSLRFAEHLATIDLEHFYDSETKNTITRLTNGITWQLPNAAYFSLAVCQSVFNTMLTTVVIGFAVWWLIPLFVILLIPMLIYESRSSAIGWFVFSKDGDSQTIFWGILSVFTEVKKQFEIRALGAKNRLQTMLADLTNGFHISQLAELSKITKWNSLTVVSQFIREAVAQSWLITQVLSKQMTVDSYLFYVSLVFRLDGAISGLFGTLAQFNEGARFSNDFRTFLLIEPKIIDKPNAMNIENKAPEIEFIEVTFRYPKSNKYVFKKLSFKINSGEKVALVGENGAGKSTIIKLLLRFYIVESGEIRINGININDIKIDSLLRQVSVLFQDFNQYSLSALDNIAISDSKPSQKNAEKAAKLSGADDFISKLEQSYETNLNPSMKNGVELSGGQWQKVALARAFYRDTSLLILDEPTSAIDSKAEYEIFNNIFTVHDQKSALIVSHRFSTVRKADRIIVIENGNVVENGVHEDLLKLGGLYAVMFNKQAEGYK